MSQSDNMLARAGSGYSNNNDYGSGPSLNRYRSEQESDNARGGRRSGGGFRSRSQSQGEGGIGGNPQRSRSRSRDRREGSRSRGDSSDSDVLTKSETQVREKLSGDEGSSDRGSGGNVGEPQNMMEGGHGGVRGGLDEDKGRGGSRSSSRGRNEGAGRFHHRGGQGGNQGGDFRRGGGDRYGNNNGGGMYNRRPDNRGGYDRRGPGGSADGGGQGNILAGPLMNFKTFLEKQPSMDRNESQYRYDKYKADWEKKQAEIFYSMHLEDCWFKERYDPLLQYKWQMEKKAQALPLAQKFVEFFVGDQTCRGLNFDQDPSIDYERLGEKAISISGEPFFGFDANQMTLYLKNIPVNVSRWDLLDVLKTTQGFVSLSMSEPLKAQNFERIAWITYDTDANCQLAKQVLEAQYVGDYRLCPVSNQGNRKGVMITPELPDDSAERDLKKCEKLITEVLDVEKEIPATIQDQITEYANRYLNKTQHLDLLLLYLRKVHSYCFYCGEEYDDERTLAAKCGPAHLRNSSKITRFMLDTPNWQTSKQFEDKYLKAADERVAKGPKEIVSPNDDPVLQQMKEQYVNKKTHILTQGSIYQCGACDKKFKTSEFVYKHFFNKHGDVLDEKFNRSRFESMMNENYHNDPKKMINQPGFAAGPPGREGGFRGGFGERGGRGGGFRGGRGDRDDGRGRSYQDYDDPSRYQGQIQNPDRQIP